VCLNVYVYVYIYVRKPSISALVLPSGPPTPIGFHTHRPVCDSRTHFPPCAPSCLVTTTWSQATMDCPFRRKRPVCVCVSVWMFVCMCMGVCVYKPSWLFEHVNGVVHTPIHTNTPPTHTDTHNPPPFPPPKTHTHDQSITCSQLAVAHNAPRTRSSSPSSMGTEGSNLCGCGWVWVGMGGRVGGGRGG
jgi:hypothetical protein